MWTRKRDPVKKFALSVIAALLLVGASGGVAMAAGSPAAKGEVIFEAAVGHLVTMVDELRAWPIAERQDMHAQPPDHSIRW